MCKKEEMPIRWQQTKEGMDPMDIGGVHLAILLLIWRLVSEGRKDLIKKIPHMYTEGEFEMFYNRFCSEFKKRRPNCPSSGYYGIYQLSCRIGIPRTGKDLHEPWVQNDIRKENICFVLSGNFREFGYYDEDLIHGGYIYDGYYSRLEGEGIGSDEPEPGGIFFSSSCFYKLCYRESFRSLQNAEFTEPFIEAVRIALHLQD